MKIIYILGYGRSGSTILNALLDQHPELTGVGELVNLVCQGWLEDGYCACGRPASTCPFWTRVKEAWCERANIKDPAHYWALQRRSSGYSSVLPFAGNIGDKERTRAFLHSTKALLDAIGEVSGCQTLVDSSKVPGWLLTLARLPDVDLRVIHLIRDGRGAVWSLGKSYDKADKLGVQHDISSRSAWQTSLSWSAANVLCEYATLRAGLSSLRLRYEELTLDPVGSLGRLGRHSDFEPASLIELVESKKTFSAGCAIAGNRLRMNRELSLAADNEWAGGLSLRDRMIYWMLAGWLGVRYGYHPWARWRNELAPEVSVTPGDEGETKRPVEKGPGKLRIMFLVRRLDIGGSERQLVTLAKGLVAGGQSVSIVSLYGGGVLEPELRACGVAVSDLGKTSRWENLRVLGRLVSAVRTYHPQIIQSILPATNLVALMLRPLFPRLPIIWGVRSTLEEAATYDRLRGWVIWLEARFSGLASRIIANSEAGAASAIRRGFPRHKLTVVSNGIDTGELKPDRSQRHLLRREWGVSETEHLIGMVARLDPIKDHLTFLNAAARLRANRSNVKFVCVGGGSSIYQDNLCQMVRQLGLEASVTWAGERFDLRKVYNALDLVTLTSLSEGFPNTLAEAMACGVACVATDVGDASRILDGTGCIVPPGDPDALASAWNETLYGCGAKKTSPQALRAKITDRFTQEVLLSETLQVFELAAR